jgi:hypothetical protein
MPLVVETKSKGCGENYEMGSFSGSEQEYSTEALSLSNSIVESAPQNTLNFLKRFSPKLIITTKPLTTAQNLSEKPVF